MTTDVLPETLTDKRARLEERRAKLAADRQLEQNVLARAQRALADGVGSPGAVAASRSNVAALDDAMGTLDAAIADVDAELARHRAQAERERRFAETVLQANYGVELAAAFDAWRTEADETFTRVIARGLELLIALEATSFNCLAAGAPLAKELGMDEETFCQELEDRGADLRAVAKPWIASQADVAPWSPYYGLTFLRHRHSPIRWTTLGAHTALIDALLTAERAKRIEETKQAEGR